MFDTERQNCMRKLEEKPFKKDMEQNRSYLLNRKSKV